MKFHKQEHLVLRNDQGQIIQAGSCYPTVIACLLDLELSQVPYFQLLYWSCRGQKENLSKYFKGRYLEGKEVSEFDSDDHRVHNFNNATGMAGHLWNTVKDMWLASIGYTEDYIEDIDAWLIANPDTPYMASGKSSRGVDHVVIYKNGKLFHDPHPSGEGLVELWDKSYAFQYLRPI